METNTISETANRRTVMRHTVYNRIKKNIVKDKFLLLMVTPALMYFIIFHYGPMYGMLMAFQDFQPLKGVAGSPWVGLRWFHEFFDSVYAFRVIKNVLLLNIYNIIWGFPIPIIFALMLNEVRNGIFKRLVQTVSYMPHFISIVVIIGMTFAFLSPNDGIVNVLLQSLGKEKINFLSEAAWFRTIYIGTGIWQNFGYNSIIYIAALTSIDTCLYEAAQIDGASRWKQLIHITLPCLTPTIIILLILTMGKMMSVGFEKIILMYNPATYSVSDVISTYVYRMGLQNSEYGYAAAVDLFNSAVNFIFLILVNKLSKKMTEVALW